MNHKKIEMNNGDTALLTTAGNAVLLGVYSRNVNMSVHFSREQAKELADKINELLVENGNEAE